MSIQTTFPAEGMCEYLQDRSHSARHGMQPSPRGPLDLILFQVFGLKLEARFLDSKGEGERGQLTLGAP